jgi:hypothetical protein
MSGNLRKGQDGYRRRQDRVPKGFLLRRLEVCAQHFVCCGSVTPARLAYCARGRLVARSGLALPQPAYPTPKLARLGDSQDMQQEHVDNPVWD